MDYAYLKIILNEECWANYYEMDDIDVATQWFVTTLSQKIGNNTFRKKN